MRLEEIFDSKAFVKKYILPKIFERLEDGKYKMVPELAGSAIVANTLSIGIDLYRIYRRYKFLKNRCESLENESERLRGQIQNSNDTTERQRLEQTRQNIEEARERVDQELEEFIDKQLARYVIGIFLGIITGAIASIWISGFLSILAIGMTVTTAYLYLKEILELFSSLANISGMISSLANISGMIQQLQRI